MPRENRFFVYMMASKLRRIYTGVTNNIERRVAQRKAGEIAGFTQRYKINRLVYYEQFSLIGNAIRLKKAIKHWVRAQRVALIERDNPTWDDLADDRESPSNSASLSLRHRKQIPRARGARDDKSIKTADAARHKNVALIIRASI